MQRSVCEAVLNGLADGKSLRAICREPDMPSPSTIIRWASDDAAFAEQYARARAHGDDAMAEDIQDIADDAELKPDDKRVRIDARKWLLAKRQPKRFGDKIEHDHKGGVTLIPMQPHDDDI